MVPNRSMPDTAPTTVKYITSLVIVGRFGLLSVRFLSTVLTDTFSRFHFTDAVADLARLAKSLAYLQSVHVSHCSAARTTPKVTVKILTEILWKDFLFFYLYM